MPGCTSSGEHKAPKHRGLNEFHLFCTDHVREYNKAWDFFSGMSEKDIEDHIIDSAYGNRPTWKYNTDGVNEETLFREAQRAYVFEDKINHHKKPEDEKYSHYSGPEFEALAIMGLEPPVTFDEIKVRYKVLAKRYHPDLNKNNKSSEELLKKVNMAYTILKMAFEEFKNLPETDLK
ncbi:MAG: J domain-containing protein [Alphaproteobacteria bacterium]|nr:J domain-containing protein [Alphaproteobacteria bacterium]